MKQLIVSIICTSSALLFSLSSYADQKFTCQYGERVREIHVLYESQDSPVPCSVQYKKEGSVQTLWSAQAQVGYCEEKAQEFLDKQQSWGWECSQEVGNTVPSEEMADEETMESDA